MTENSKIEWTDHTFNPWVGCSKVSPACDFCYAEAWAKRSGLVVWGEQRRRTAPMTWRQPLKWNAAVPEGERRRVFCASLADVFDNEVPQSWREELWALIRSTPRLDWLLLTKRIGNARSMMRQARIEGAHNIWLGATVINQQEFDRDVPRLLALTARVRFLSIEPMLGPIAFDPDPLLLRGLDWIICGGESGAHARPLEIAWAADLRAQSEVRDIAFFMKQGSRANWAEFKDFASFPASVRIREFPVDRRFT